MPKRQKTRILLGGLLFPEGPRWHDGKLWLGGFDRRTLFICTAGSSAPEEVRAKPGGKIEIIEVEVPGAGLP